eukprot:scaffold201146_cov20-Tisochrysis_lutea.AAC.1
MAACIIEFVGGPSGDGFKQRTFTAKRNGGAFLEGQPLVVSKTRELRDAILVGAVPVWKVERHYGSLIAGLAPLQCHRRGFVIASWQGMCRCYDVMADQVPSWCPPRRVKPHHGAAAAAAAGQVSLQELWQVQRCQCASAEVVRLDDRASTIVVPCQCGAMTIGQVTRGTSVPVWKVSSLMIGQVPEWCHDNRASDNRCQCASLEGESLDDRASTIMVPCHCGAMTIGQVVTGASVPNKLLNQMSPCTVRGIEVSNWAVAFSCSLAAMLSCAKHR